jgi:hypothetical protein
VGSRGAPDGVPASDQEDRIQLGAVELMHISQVLAHPQKL